MIRVRLNEEEYRKYRNLLLEDQESESQKQAIKYAVEHYDMSEEEATHFIKKKFRMEIQSLNGNRKAGKFTLGAFRLYMDITTQQEKDRLNEIILKITNDNELYKKYNKNLNALDLLDLYTEVNSNYKGGEIKEINRNRRNYKLVKIDSFEEAAKYGKYTSWCITHYENMFNRYTEDGIVQFYFLLENGFTNVEKEKGRNSPLDDYGLSMIAISVKGDGSLKTSTTRWNHDMGANDRMFSIDDIKQLAGPDICEEIFKPSQEYIETMEHIKNIKLIDASMNAYKIENELYKIFDKVFTNKRSDVYFYNCIINNRNFMIVNDGSELKIIADSYSFFTVKENFNFLFIEKIDSEDLYDIYDYRKNKFIRRNLVIKDLDDDYFIYEFGEDKERRLCSPEYGFVNKDINGKDLKFTYITQIYIDDSNNILAFEDSSDTLISLYNIKTNEIIAEGFDTKDLYVDSDRFTFLNNGDCIYVPGIKNLQYYKKDENKVYSLDFDTIFNDEISDGSKIYYGKESKKSDNLIIFNPKNIKIEDGKIVPTYVDKDFYKESPNTMNVCKITEVLPFYKNSKYIIIKGRNKSEPSWKLITLDGKLIIDNVFSIPGIAILKEYISIGKIKNITISNYKEKIKSATDGIDCCDYIVTNDGNLYILSNDLKIKKVS